MMKIQFCLLTLICSLFLSCEADRIKNLTFEGDLIAKQILSVKFDLPESCTTPEIAWYISHSPDSSWEKLRGIWTTEIVLLTSYEGRYIKCEISCTPGKGGKKTRAEIVSSSPVAVKDNPNTDWFHNAGFGIMVHYLSTNMVQDKGSKEWNDAVDSFNTDEFASKVSQTGAGFVMFTLGQNSGYYCSPNSVFDSIVGVGPGDLCSRRDLPADLIRSLKKYKIPVILYLPSNPPISNRMVSEKFRYSFGKDSATSQYNQPLLEKMIREWSLRYADDVRGWWFDGLYEGNGIRGTRMDMSLKHNISTHTLAAKAGNRHSIVTYNYGFGKIHANTPYCDYSSGEKMTIDEYPSSRWVEPGVQWFLFTYLGEKWGGSGSQFCIKDLTEKAKKIVENGGVLCLEVVVNPNGDIIPHHLEQIKEVGKALGKI
ncbi:MAG: alpha-L-fucosidase [Bacteroidales bacterium]|nr:alpha-L-fucosidase [Bacteroidales bacterium]